LLFVVIKLFVDFVFFPVEADCDSNEKLAAPMKNAGKKEKEKVSAWQALPVRRCLSSSG
jgi:hypothetical protein